LIFEKPRGFFAKLLGIIDFRIIFVRKKMWTQSTGRGPRPASVHCGPRWCGRERGGAPTGGGRGGRGGALTRDGAAVKRPGVSCKAAVMKARGRDEHRRERGGKEDSVGCGEMRRGWGAFYRCRGGAGWPDGGGE
jgi:hypothetical protein